MLHNVLSGMRSINGFMAFTVEGKKKIRRFYGSWISTRFYSLLIKDLLVCLEIWKFVNIFTETDSILTFSNLKTLES